MSNKSRKERLIVVGGNAAGMSAASKAKRLHPQLEVIALERTPHVSYSACGIPYYISDLVREPAELIAITPRQFEEQRGIQMLTLHEVLAVNPVQRTVIARSLESLYEKCFEYDRLVLSTGGLPAKPNIAGVDLKNVFTVQTLQDGIRIKSFVDEKRPERAVIIGGGYIAMEMAEAFSKRFLGVTIIEKEAQILPGFDERLTAQVVAELQAHDVRILTSKNVEEFVGDETGDVRAVTVTGLDAPVPADLVLSCMGLLPNTALAESAGVRLGNTGAIAVDWKMQTNVANIYAAGDCAEVKNLVTGKPDYIPLGSTANKQGRVAGENIGGGFGAFKGVVGTSVFKVFSLEVARTGLDLQTARQFGFNPAAVVITAPAKAAYFAGAREITISVIFDHSNARLLGAQMVGKEGVSKRIDVFATALCNKMTLHEMAYLDLSYAPPFAPVWDPVLVAVQAARKKL
ncbi:MAG: FAD-dependent oxidoreductase [bacterium]